MELDRCGTEVLFRGMLLLPWGCHAEFVVQQRDCLSVCRGPLPGSASARSAESSQSSGTSAGLTSRSYTEVGRQNPVGTGIPAEINSPRLAALAPTT
jgi:hypothetical protein